MRERLRRTGINVAFMLCVSIVLVVAFELLGRFVIFTDRLELFDDVDHRMDSTWPGVNSDGIRSRVEADVFGPEQFNIVLLGDSFVYGLYLSNRETISQQLQTLARRRYGTTQINVLNFGWISASPLLSYRQLVDIGAKYHPDVVVECVDMTDVEDDIKYARFLAREGIYRAVGVVPATFLTVRKLMTMLKPLHGLHERILGFPARRFFHSDAPLDQTVHFFADIRRNLESLYAFCRDELGAGFVVAVFPRAYQYSDRESPSNWEAAEYEPLGPHATEAFRYFDAMAAEVPFPVHSLLPDFLATDVFPTCLPDDPHWTADGAGVAARALFDYLVADGVFDAFTEVAAP